MLPRYPYWRLLLLTLAAALLLSKFVHEYSLPNWWIHPIGIGFGLLLYALLFLYKRDVLITFEAGRPIAAPASGLNSVEYYWRLVSVSFVLASPFEFIASLMR
jgi:hypothetical protein